MLKGPWYNDSTKLIILLFTREWVMGPGLFTYAYCVLEKCANAASLDVASWCVYL